MYILKSSSVARASVALATAAVLASAALPGAASAQRIILSPPFAQEPTVAVPVTSFPFPLAAKAYFDTYYNVCRGAQPLCYNPWILSSSRQNKILMYSRTAGPRHAHLGPALAAGLNPPLTAANISQNALIAWVGALGISADYTEDVSQLGSLNLNNYRAILYNSTSRDTHWKHGTAVNPTSAVDTSTNAHLDAAKTALRQYMRAGGGFVGVHNTIGGTEYNWVYFEGLGAGTQYYDHGPEQLGTVHVVQTDTSNDPLPDTFQFTDEWYNFFNYPHGVKFLLTIDETSLAAPPGGKNTNHPGHGAFHPQAWCQYYDGGRSFFTALGHDSKSYTDADVNTWPGQAQFKAHLTQGILGAMGSIPFCEVPANS
jgi:uncharacterized protein